MLRAAPAQGANPTPAIRSLRRTYPMRKTYSLALPGSIENRNSRLPLSLIGTRRPLVLLISKTSLTVLESLNRLVALLAEE